MPSDDAWAAAEATLSPSARLTGTVLSHRAFGFFVRLDDHRGVPGLVQVVDYKTKGVQPRYDHDAALWLRESNRQVLSRFP